MTVEKKKQNLPKFHDNRNVVLLNYMSLRNTAKRHFNFAILLNNYFYSLFRQYCGKVSLTFPELFTFTVSYGKRQIIFHYYANYNENMVKIIFWNNAEVF